MQWSRVEGVGGGTCLKSLKILKYENFGFISHGTRGRGDVSRL